MISMTLDLVSDMLLHIYIFCVDNTRELIMQIHMDAFVYSKLIEMFLVIV